MKPKKNSRLKEDFFKRDPLPVAKDLIGCYVSKNGRLAEIVETEGFTEAGRSIGGKENMKQPPGRWFIARYRGGPLANVTTYPPKEPSCVWIRRVSYNGEVYGPIQWTSLFEIDERYNGLSVENDRLHILPLSRLIEKVSPRSSTSVGGYKLEHLDE